MNDIGVGKEDFVPESLKALVKETDEKLRDAKKSFNSELKDIPERGGFEEGVMTPPSNPFESNQHDPTRILSAIKQDYSFSDTDDRTPGTNPAAALTTPQARALALEGSSTIKKTPSSMSKNLFEESFFSPSAVKEMPKKSSFQLAVEKEKKMLMNQPPMVVTTSAIDSNISPLRQTATIKSHEVTNKDLMLDTLNDTKNMHIESHTRNQLAVEFRSQKVSTDTLNDKKTENSSSTTQMRENLPIDSTRRMQADKVHQFGKMDIPVNPRTRKVEPQALKVGNDSKILSVTSSHKQHLFPSDASKVSSGAPKETQENYLGSPSSEINVTTAENKKRNKNNFSPSYMRGTKSSIQKTPQKILSRESMVHSESEDASKLLSSKIRSLRKSPPVLSPEAKEGMAKARERVKQRKIAEQKRKAELEGNADRVSKTISPHSKEEKSISRVHQKELQVDAQIKMQEERRRRIATKLRAEGAGLTIPRPPKLSGGGGHLPKPTISSENRARLVAAKNKARNQTPVRYRESPRITTPEPFHFHGPSPSRARGNMTLAEKTRAFEKAMRESKTPKKNISRPRVTTPKPFKFHESRSSSTPRNRASSTPKPPRARTMAEFINDFDNNLRDIPVSQKREMSITKPKPFKFHETRSSSAPRNRGGSTPKPPRAQTMAECINDFDHHLRDLPAPRKRDISKPTIPVSPNFTRLSKREKVKSTAEKEQEIVDYYNNHKFKATPIRHQTNSRVAPKKKPKKKLTVPKPFNLSSDRGASSRRSANGENETKARGFRARPMPNFNTGSK